jgi:hypothetical protein
MKQIIGGKLYNTETAEPVASDKYWDGHNWDRNGRSIQLYKTPKGAFFMHFETRWQGELDRIETVSESEARKWYEELPKHEMEYVDAFGEEPEEA